MEAIARELPELSFRENGFVLWVCHGNQGRKWEVDTMSFIDPTWHWEALDKKMLERKQLFVTDEVIQSRMAEDAGDIWTRAIEHLRILAQVDNVSLPFQRSTCVCNGIP